MQKNVLTKAVAVALATLGAGGAMAQSSVTLYGNVDVSVDHVSRSAGTSTSPTAKYSATRVSPSATSQTSFGFKGVEDLGGGMKASFVLEGQLNHDTGALSQDGRIFGRQSYVGLTTNFGEFRLGRQYAPIFYSTALVTTERFGATDLFIEGGASNNLHVRHDNQISYWLKAGGFTGELSYSPNAGVASIISPARAPAATASTGQIIGGATAGSETGTKAGRTFGLFGAYSSESLTLTGGYHQNAFDNTPVSYGGVFTTNFNLDKYQAFNLGAKFTVPNSSGLTFNGVYGQGKYGLTDGRDLKLDFLAIGTRIPVGDWALVAQASQTRFRNFTKGKDAGLMLGADYALSKRTSLFTRVGQIRDDQGTPFAATALGAAGPSVAGGPDVIGVATGFRETPIFAGANINPDGKTTYIGMGIRHSF